MRILFLSLLANPGEAKTETDTCKSEIVVLRRVNVQRESAKLVFAHPSNENAWFWGSKGRTTGGATTRQELVFNGIRIGSPMVPPPPPPPPGKEKKRIFKQKTYKYVE